MAIEIRAKPGKQPTDKGSAQPKSWLPVQSKIGDRERMVFTEQLALLLETGTNLHGALQGMRDRSGNPAMRELLDALIDDISEGKPFSYALARHPDIFSTTYVTLISASETGGFLHEVLAQLLETDRKRAELKATVVSALSYPAFLALFSVSVVIFVLVVVFPKFGAMFAAIRDELPPSTKALMWMSEYLQAWWPHTLIVLVTLAVLAYRWLRTPAGRQRMGAFKLSFPPVRDLFAQLYLAQVMRVMGLSMSNGVNVMDTLEACRDVVDNDVFRDFIAEVQTSVQQGNGVAARFNEAPFVPEMARQMIHTGEETGNLGLVMQRIADYYDDKLSNRLKAISKMAEPVMLLVMGLVVGVLVSSLILPIFQLSRAVS